MRGVITRLDTVLWCLDARLGVTHCGRQLHALELQAKGRGHQPLHWALLFSRWSDYHVYWTRCGHCGVQGRLTVISRNDERIELAAGRLFEQDCPGRPSWRRP